jgi:hypothetical protein
LMATRLVCTTFLVRNAKDVEPSARRLRWLREQITRTRRLSPKESGSDMPAAPDFVAIADHLDHEHSR